MSLLFAHPHAHATPRDYRRASLNVYWDTTNACSLACKHCRAMAPSEPSGGDRYSIGEEIANVATHGLGAVLSGAALALLLDYAVRFGDVWRIVSSAVFGTMLVVLYTASTIYHAVPSRGKHVAKIVDHASIYLLIAGTYSPFTLVTLRATWGWGLFAAVWSLALLGVCFEAFWVYRPKWLSAVVYLAMGWMVIFSARTLAASLAPGGLALLLGGGLFYSVGTIFYVMKKMPYHHAVWHGFVLGGSVCHVLAVVLYVIPGATR